MNPEEIIQGRLVTFSNINQRLRCIKRDQKSQKISIDAKIFLKQLQSLRGQTLLASRVNLLGDTPTGFVGQIFVLMGISNMGRECEATG